METYTKIILAGAALFVIPVPGTFILGALVMLAGTALYGLRQ